MEKSCASETQGRRTFGADHWKTLQKRIASLLAAPSLKDMDAVPGRCHALSADRHGQFAVSLWGGHRLIFVPDHDPIPSLSDGGIDLARITKISITEVVNYHGD